MISVAICTRNRSDLLRGTLESLAQMRETDGLEWELLLVDNGSSDDTRAVSDDFASRLPLRYVVEPGWLSAYAIQDFSEAVVELSFPRKVPYGANLCCQG